MLRMSSSTIGATSRRSSSSLGTPKCPPTRSGGLIDEMGPAAAGTTEQEAPAPPAPDGVLRPPPRPAGTPPSASPRRRPGSTRNVAARPRPFQPARLGRWPWRASASEQHDVEAAERLADAWRGCARFLDLRRCPAGPPPPRLARAGIADDQRAALRAADRAARSLNTPSKLFLVAGCLGRDAERAVLQRLLGLALRRRSNVDRKVSRSANRA